MKKDRPENFLKAKAKNSYCILYKKIFCIMGQFGLLTSNAIKTKKSNIFENCICWILGALMKCLEGQSG